METLDTENYSEGWQDRSGNKGACAKPDDLSLKPIDRSDSYKLFFDLHRPYPKQINVKQIFQQLSLLIRETFKHLDF